MHNGEADARWEKRLRALGMAVVGIQRMTHMGEPPGPVLHEVRFKLESDNRTSVLVILKAHGEDEELVGFVGGLDLETALLAAEGKLRAGAVRWREDRPWGG